MNRLVDERYVLDMKRSAHPFLGLAVLAAVTLSITSCAAGRAQPGAASPVPLPTPTGSEQAISTANLGYLWPLKVKHGKIACRPGTQAVFIAPDGKAYALNDRASTRYPSIDPLRENGAGGTFISLGAMRSDALRLCSSG